MQGQVDILEGKVQLLSLEAIHQLHIFIFVLAIVHVIFSVLTMLLGGAKIRQWKHWEDSIANDKYNMEEVLGKKVTHVQQHSFIREHSLGFARNSSILSWLFSFFKQFYASVTKSDYITLRLGFIMTHCKGNPKFNFYKYMMRALEADFKKVVGISWYLWVFVMIFLLLNVGGWHTYFWIAFIPLILLLAVGAKLEHVITKLAHDVADKHTAIEGDLVVQPSDNYFWFRSPRLVLYLIHFILFQNAFEIAFFFWILMGSSFKKAIFDEHVHESLLGWAQKVKKRKGFKPIKEGGDTSTHTNRASGSSDGIEMQKVETESLLEAGNANIIKALSPAPRAS
ncbi:MLO-like protein 1 [Nymphaea thermarum]|nr:MLO-like protein 1 [Nymphaea thermarum]